MYQGTTVDTRVKTSCLLMHQKSVSFCRKKHLMRNKSCDDTNDFCLLVTECMVTQNFCCEFFTLYSFMFIQKLEIHGSLRKKLEIHGSKTSKARNPWFEDLKSPKSMVRFRNALVRLKIHRFDFEMHRCG